jgi:hypothetical protein
MRRSLKTLILQGKEGLSPHPSSPSRRRPTLACARRGVKHRRFAPASLLDPPPVARRLGLPTGRVQGVRRQKQQASLRKNLRRERIPLNRANPYTKEKKKGWG